MIRCIIFDLSEVLIAGLVGIEKTLSLELPVPEDEILPCFAGRWLEELLVGNISEKAYLNRIIAREGWQIDVVTLQAAIRHNFHKMVEGAVDILMALAYSYELALLSDHAREWVSYIKPIHPFLQVFGRTFFSYDLKTLKNDPQTFLHVLDVMSVSPDECLFIDDNPANVRVARSVGIPGIRFVNAGQLAAELDGRLTACVPPGTDAKAALPTLESTCLRRITTNRNGGTL
jgi:FMN phosphatase YigB (HAD superfamily)